MKDPNSLRWPDVTITEFVTGLKYQEVAGMPKWHPDRARFLTTAEIFGEECFIATGGENIAK